MSFVLDSKKLQRVASDANVTRAKQVGENTNAANVRYLSLSNKIIHLAMNAHSIMFIVVGSKRTFGIDARHV